MLPIEERGAFEMTETLMELLTTVAVAAGIGLVASALVAWLEERMRRGRGAASETTGQRAFWGHLIANFWFFIFGVIVTIFVDFIFGF
jgi:ABC-type Fe3+ transport system permease subunit